MVMSKSILPCRSVILWEMTPFWYFGSQMQRWLVFWNIFIRLGSELVRSGCHIIYNSATRPNRACCTSAYSQFVNSRPVRQALLRLVQQALLRQVMWPCHMQGWAFSGFDTHNPNQIFGEKSLQIGGGPQFFWPTIYVISCARAGVWTKQVLDWIFNDFISQYQ